MYYKFQAYKCEHNKEYQASISKFLLIKSMKTEQSNIDNIRSKFSALQSKEDLVSLLSEARNILYEKEIIPFQLKSITYYANPGICKNRYKTFTIRKKNGGERTIHAPVKGLKTILHSLNYILQCIHSPHKAATGFVIGKSIVDNAKKHAGSNYVFNTDLKDFFFSFDRIQVKMALMKAPFNLTGEKEELAFLIACLCTHPLEIDGKVINVLPQGSPTSPTLTNILCEKLDRRLTGLANRFGATYTRYADDITFSSQHSIYKDDVFRSELERIIRENNLFKFKDNKELVIGPQLKINEKKTRLQKAGYKQEVTGLVVNDNVNVQKRYVKQLRMWLYYWESYGYAKAEQIFTKDYKKDKGHIKKGKPNLDNVIGGKLNFLKMVKGENDNVYNKLSERFNKLSGINSTEIKITTTNILNLHDSNQNDKLIILSGHDSEKNKTISLNKIELDITLKKLFDKDFDLSIL